MRFFPGLDSLELTPDMWHLSSGGDAPGGNQRKVDLGRGVGGAGREPGQVRWEEQGPQGHRTIGK